ncbi:MAG: hypothetical protein HY754_12245 [Nitrospirae bacterium]|nr:hypothetical protein [Nitrospirota bacterium]
MGKVSKKNLLRNPIFHLFLVAIIGILAYSNTFNVPFQFDDNFNIGGNFVNKELLFSGGYSDKQNFEEYLRYVFFRSRYIGYLTFAMNYKVHGSDVTGYHIVNLTIHILNAILVYWLVVLTLRTLEYQRVKVSKF